MEAGKRDDLEFIHRSVGDFFIQENVRIKMRNESFHCMEALSQLKLASIKHYWWDVGQQNGTEGGQRGKTEEESLSRHSILVACLIEQRRRLQLDTPPFGFLECMDNIPQISVSKTVEFALASKKTAFRINLCEPGHGKLVARGEPLLLPYSHFEFCHSSRVRHIASDPMPGERYWIESTEKQHDTERSTTLWREADEEVDDVEIYSGVVISPMFTELCSGRLEYPIWRTKRVRDVPLDQESLSMLVYCAIGAGLGRATWQRNPTTNADHNNDDDDDDGDGGEVASRTASLRFFRHLLEQEIVSPNSLTHLAYGGEFGFIRIAAGNQRLSIWQHFLCWWATVAAASGDFEPERDTSDYEPSDYASEQFEASSILRIFIENGADLRLTLKIHDGKDVPTYADDIWLSYALELIPDDGEPLELDVVVNLNTRRDLGPTYPYGPPKQRHCEPHDDESYDDVSLPKSHLSVRDWIDRSRLPDKDVLLKLIDEKSALEGLEDVGASERS